MKYKIVADSSCDLLSLENVDFDAVPLHIVVGERDFADNESVDCDEMQRELDNYRGKTSTACPAPEEWVQAFGDAEVVFGVTLTSQLSGAYSSANIAKQMYEEDNPERRVYLFDSLSTGPEMTLIIRKIEELINLNLNAEEIYRKVCDYMEHTHLYFSLASLNNFAKNGRISPVLAKGIGVLGIRIVGRASKEGTLEPIDKARGDLRAVQKIIKHMKDIGYINGRICIAHNNNMQAAMALRDAIKEHFGAFNGTVHRTRALCSYYAEPESVLIGFEA